MSTPQFELAGGSIIGREHRLVPRNNQDAYCMRQGESVTVAIVADGCGSSPHSEVGAQLGARLIAEAVYQAAKAPLGLPAYWQEVRRYVLDDLGRIVSRMGGDYRRTVEEYFLFTVVGAVLAYDTAHFFACGDGIIVINGEVTRIGPYPNNAPPYLAYGLGSGELFKGPGSAPQFTVFDRVPLAELDSFLIGTDGMLDLIGSAEHRLPGTQDLVGGIEQFWQQDRYFLNPELVHRRLKLIGRDWPKRDPEPGLLGDDTTLIVGRKQPAVPESAGDKHT